MKQHYRKNMTLAALLATLTIATSSATAEFKPIGEGEGLILGLGLVAVESAYLDVDDSEITGFPYIAYQWENAHLGIDGFNYDFYDNGTISFTADVETRWSFTEADDSPLFN